MMNEGYAAPCGSVMGVQDADPRSSKELRRWELMREATMKQDDLIDQLTLAHEHVTETMSHISVQGELVETEAILSHILEELRKGPVTQ